MENYSLIIKSDEKKGVLDDITSIIVAHEVNISYTHLFIEKNNVGTIDLELEHVEDIDSLIADLESLKEVKSVEIHSSPTIGSVSTLIRSPRILCLSASVIAPKAT